MVLVGIEDQPGEAVARKLVVEAGFDPSVCDFIVEKGSELKRHLSRYLSASERRPTLVLPDLDQSACAPSKIADWMNGKIAPQMFMLRVAVREIESWLLADRSGFHRYFRIPINRITSDPDLLENPKAELLSLVLGAPDTVRKGFVRTETGRVLRGVLYNPKLTDYVYREWSARRAAQQSGSLAKARRALSSAYAAYGSTAPSPKV